MFSKIGYAIRFINFYFLLLNRSDFHSFYPKKEEKLIFHNIDIMYVHIIDYYQD